MEPLLKQALRVSKDAGIPGQDAAIDNQQMVFKELMRIRNESVKIEKEMGFNRIL